MKTSRFPVVLLFISVLALAPHAFAQTPAVRERIQASYILAFGRAASEGDIGYWAKQNPKSVGDIVAQHRLYLSKDVGTHRGMIARAYVDSFGRNPTEGEINHWMAGNDPYFQLMKNNMAWLAQNPAEYERVIKRSYQLVFNRAPSAGEIGYWRGQPTLSYLMLAASHDDWKRQKGNAPQTSGPATISNGSAYLTAAPVSASIASESFSATGLVASGGGNLVASGGGNLVASGGGNLVASGGGNLVASGGGN